MHPVTRDQLRGTLPLPKNDVPCIRVLVPGLDTGVFELSPAQYQAMVCAILNTPADEEQLRLYQVRVDNETLLIPAHGIFHAFRIARASRPEAIVVTDTTGE